MTIEVSALTALVLRATAGSFNILKICKMKSEIRNEFVLNYFKYRSILWSYRIDKLVLVKTDYVAKV